MATTLRGWHISAWLFGALVGFVGMWGIEHRPVPASRVTAATRAPRQTADETPKILTVSELPTATLLGPRKKATVKRREHAEVASKPTAPDSKRAVVAEEPLRQTDLLVAQVLGSSIP